MGYRSDVYFITNYDIYKKCFNLKVFQDADTAMIFKKDNKKYVYYCWEYVKWYDCYEDIKEFNEFLSTIEDGFDFLRIGDDPEDIEYNFNLDIIEFERSVTVQIDGKDPKEFPNNCIVRESLHVTK